MNTSMILGLQQGKERKKKKKQELPCILITIFYISRTHSKYYYIELVHPTV